MHNNNFIIKIEQLKDNNFQNVLAVSNLESEVTRIKGYLERLAGNIIPRNEKLTDAYLKLTYDDRVYYNAREGLFKVYPKK